MSNRPHILIASFDSVRRDWIGCYGNSEGITPNIDKVAGTGVLFTGAVANSSWTLPQHMTFFTGEYPLSHGMISLLGNRPLSPEKKLLSEYLHEAGYITFAVTNANRYGGGGLFGYDRGIGYQTCGLPLAGHSTRSADAAIKYWTEYGSQGPCYMYVHFNEAHEPKDTPPGFMEEYGSDRSFIRRGVLGDGYKCLTFYEDYCFGRIVESLKELGIYEDTLIVVLTDHGRDYGEHGSFEKKLNHYNEVMDIAFVMGYPGELPPGCVVYGLAESVDVTPTILDLVGISPAANVQGQSLLPRIFDPVKAPRPEMAFSHTFLNWEKIENPNLLGNRPQYDQLSVRTSTHKYIRTAILAETEDRAWSDRLKWLANHVGLDYETFDKGTIVTELYNLVDDPREQHPIGHRWPGLEADMSEKTDAWVSRTQSRSVSLMRSGEVIPRHDLENTRKRLQALGYLD